MRFSTLMKRMIAVLCAAILAASLLWFLGSCIAVRNRERGNSRLRELYRGGGFSLLPAALAESGGDAPEYLPIQPDFIDLYAINPHIVGWLVAGKDIDLPVVQYDNEYYLSHDFYGHSDHNGTLFVNAANRLLPRDEVVLIHGHNMKSGAQFGRLRRFEEYRYAARHPIVSFRTIWDEDDVDYVVPAAFNASMTEGNPEYFDIGRLRFQPAEEEEIEGGSADYAEYLARLKGQSIWDAPIDLLRPTGC